MGTASDISGQRFGQLIVHEKVGKDRFGGGLWRCLCSCGNESIVRRSSLIQGQTKSCGCGISSATRRRLTTHGQTHTPLYQHWRAMLNRCQRETFSDWHNYGGRGITVCERWQRFEAFAEDMKASFKPGLTLDRIDNNMGYSPDNCRWATRAEQGRNKRTNHRVTWCGRTLVVQDWAEFLGIKPNTLVHRLRRGWSVDRALTTGANPTALASLMELANGGDCG